MNVKRAGRLTAVLGGVASLAGCMSLSGLSGSSSYACKAPDGVTCQSVSGTYANAVANNLPAQRARATPAVGPELAPPLPAVNAPGVRNASSAAALALPLRSAPRILRLWFKPWEDADRDLYDQGYVYVQVDGGRWLVDHAQRAIREAYAPVRAPAGRGTADAAPRAPAAGVQRPAGLEQLIPGLPARPATPASGDGPD